MHMFRILWSALLIVAVSAPVVRADDVCADDEEQKAIKAQIGSVQKAEKTGKPSELFVAYRGIVGNECVDDAIRARAKANIPKLGRELAKAAEAKGVFYSKEPVRADGQTSAFRYYEAIGDFIEANRVMLKAVHAQPENMELFQTAWDADEGRQVRDPKTGNDNRYTSPPAYRQELQKVASANADKWMKAEEKDAPGLSGSSSAANVATMSSLEKLKKASDWMKFLPDGDKPARARAEQRGDVVMKRADPMFTRGSAEAFYKFSGSPKANEMVKQLEAKQKESEHALEKSAEKVKGSITHEKSAAEQKKFDKGKKDLEKELGF